MATINRVYFVLFIGILKDVKLVCGGLKCDKTKSTNVHAGELGLHAAFPWLGLLRVHLYESKKTALSGVVLVSDRYAIGNAEDIARIPRRIFRSDTDVLFIPSTGETWVCRLLDYLTHPDYDNHISTIALVELDLVGKEQVPLSAVCWPQGTTNPYELYALGYSDALDNNIEFGKMILKIKHENKTTCDAFYDNVGLTANGFQLEQFLCAVAVDPTEDCIWETGMAMVSNATGVWTLIGLSVQGPACEKPARFLEFFLYLEWIQSAIDRNISDSYRRSGHGLGFKKIKKKEKQDIFIHETFLSYLKSGRRKSYKKVDPQDLDDLGLSIYPYPFDLDSHYNFKIDRIDKDAINISVFDNTYEVEGSCHRYSDLIYHDRTRVVANGSAGTAAYRLTLYDMLLNNLTCVQVEVKSKSRSPAKLWWMTYIDKGEGTAFRPYPETPKALLKIFQQKSLYQPPPMADGRWVPKEHLEPQMIEDPNDILDIMNINLLIKLFFIHEAQLKVKVYGIPGTPPTTIKSIPATSRDLSALVHSIEDKTNFQHKYIFHQLKLPRRREYSQEDHQYIRETPETPTHQFNNYNDLAPVNLSERHWYSAKDNRYEDKYRPQSYTSEHPESQLQRGHVERDQDYEEERDPKHQSKTFNDLHHGQPPLLHRNTEKYRHYKGENIPGPTGPRIMLWPESYREKDQDNVGYKQKTHKHKHQFNPLNDPNYSNISLRHWSTEKDHNSKRNYRPESRLPKHQFNTNSEKDYDNKESNKNESHKPKHQFKTFNDPHHSNITLRHWSAEKDRYYRPSKIDEKEKPLHHALIWPRGSIKRKHNPKINNWQRQNPKEGDINQNEQGNNYSKNSYGLHNRSRQDLDGVPHQKPVQGQNVGRGQHDVESLTQEPQRMYEIKKNEGSKGNPLILRLEDY